MGGSGGKVEKVDWREEKRGFKVKGWGESEVV
jgi:hypothetical protein